MAAIEQIYVGVCLIALGMTVKVAREGLRHIAALHEKMVQLRKTTLGYREKMEQDAKEITVMEDGLEELTMEVDGLEEKVSRAAKKTELLRQKYESPDGTKHKVHVEE